MRGWRSGYEAEGGEGDGGGYAVGLDEIAPPPRPWSLSSRFPRCRRVSIRGVGGIWVRTKVGDFEDEGECESEDRGCGWDLEWVLG